MESFWSIIQSIVNGLGNKDISGMMEFELESEDLQQSYITFHTNKDDMLVISVFDPEQWSLICDMSKFMDKPVEEIVKGLDPSGPNIRVVNPDELDKGPDTF